MYKLLLIGLGGAMGTLFRWWTGGLLRGWMERTMFPLGTLAVNVAGCFVFGFLQGRTEQRFIREELRLALMVGFLGGYTTFSTYGGETMAFLRGGQYWRAAANVLANNVAGLAAAMLGYYWGRGRP